MSSKQERQPARTSITTMRVTKKLAPSNPGAIKLAQQLGTSLICVRHQVDAEAKFRFTIVELLVETSEMQPRQPQLVNVRVYPKE
jgi:hypothetical protein